MGAAPATPSADDGAEEFQHRGKAAGAALRPASPAGRGNKDAARAAPPPARPLRGGVLLLIVAWYAAMVALSQYNFWRTPAPLPASAPPEVFAEARARAHTRALVETPGRQVSLPGLDAAHHYILRHGRRLAAEAKRRGNVDVQVDLESHDGAFEITFMGHPLTNAYLNVTNVLLLVTPKGPAAAMPAVMVVAHHDAPVSSQGAGDDAGMVGTMLELASNLVAGGAPLEAPVLFLFSGAEEPLCQSASAFMHFSKWAPRVGAFINLEALGPGGVPIVFQHAGAWTIRAYARSAAHPRGAISAQDIFDAGLVLGETDFSRLSYRHAGGLPGLDIAFLADGAAYHTGQDTMERLRSGVLQEVGETLHGVVREFGRELAARQAAGQFDKGQQQQQQQQQDARRRGAWGGPPEGEPEKELFFSLGTGFMVTYPVALALRLHPLPLAIGATLPWALAAAMPGAALPPAAGLAAAAGGAVRALAGLLLTPLLAGAFGVARALLSGKPMIWFANPLAVGLYFAVGLAVQLLIYSGTAYASGSAGGARAGKGQAAGGKGGGAHADTLVAYHALGGAMMNGLIAAAATPLGVGMSFVFFLWASCGVLAAPLALALGATSALGAAAVLALTALPAYTCCEMALGVCLALVDRMSLTGHVFTGLGDGVAGVLTGVGVTAILGGVATPLLAAALGRRTRRAAWTLLLASTVLAAVGSAVLSPYSSHMPKRLLLKHLHRTEPAGAAASAPAHVRSRIVDSAWAFAGADSTPIDALLSAMGLPTGAAAAAKGGPAAAGDEWGSIYPISELLDARLLPAKAAAPPPVRVLPYIRLVAEDTNVLTAAEGGGTYRDVEFEVWTDRPCWGMLNLTAPSGMLSWSLTPARWPRAAAPTAKAVRFTSQLAARRPWRLSVRLAAGGGGGAPLGVRLHVDYIADSPQLAAMISRLPKWGTITYAATGYISDWEL